MENQTTDWHWNHMKGLSFITCLFHYIYKIWSYRSFKAHLNTHCILAQMCNPSEWTRLCSHVASALDHMQLLQHAIWLSVQCYPSFSFHVAETFSMLSFWWMLWKFGHVGASGCSDFSMCSSFSEPGMPERWPGARLPFIFRMTALCQAQVAKTLQIHLQYMSSKRGKGTWMCYKSNLAVVLKCLGFCMFSISFAKYLFINKSLEFGPLLLCFIEPLWSDGRMPNIKRHSMKDAKHLCCVGVFGCLSVHLSLLCIKTLLLVTQNVK